MTAYMDHKNLANEVIDDARAREITDGVHRVLDRIAAAEEQAGREAGSVRLLAATKTRDIGEIMAAIDAGIVSQNISIACSGLGLITVPRASMDKEALAQKLKLKSTQLLLMNNPVGKE